MADEKTTDITEEQAKQIAAQIYGSAPTPETEKSVHAFLKHIATAESTTRTGYLTEEELGLPKLPERTLKELALFCKEVANETEIGNYFDDKAEILTATSLSKEGFLAKLAVVTRRETSNILKTPAKKNKGWFGKKKKSTGEF